MDKRIIPNQKNKKYIRLNEGAGMYGMGISKFTQLSKEAKAYYKIDRLVLVNCEIFEKYLEGFRPD